MIYYSKPEIKNQCLYFNNGSMKWKFKKFEINIAVRSCGSGCQTASPRVKQNLPVTEYKFWVSAVLLQTCSAV
jgi:hypothetical protein